MFTFRKWMLKTIQLSTKAGKVLLRNVFCLIVEAEQDQILLGDPELNTLGIRPDDLLDKLGLSNGNDIEENQEVSGRVFSVEMTDTDIRQKLDPKLLSDALVKLM